jgi:glutamate 5-kinase
MITKYGLAKQIAVSGTPVHIANGYRENILIDILENKATLVQTYFAPGKKITRIKNWLSFSEPNTKGEVYINKFARESLLSEKATSLLLVGVTEVKGNFMKGDIIKIIDHEGMFLGLGKSQYNAETAIKKIGEKNNKPIIHYDYLYLKGK